jgi:mRNA interferase HigB
MHIISRKALLDFWILHADAEAPLRAWFRLADKGGYPNFAALKTTFGSVDKIGESFVFDIGGNKYRLIACIVFPSQT